MEPKKIIEVSLADIEDMSSEYEARKENLAAEAAARIEKGQHWLDWLAIGEGLVVGRLRAMRRSGTNRPEGSAYNRCFGDWMDAHTWARDLDRATRNHAVWCADHRDEVERWRETLAKNVRANLNHPTSIKRRYDKSHAVDKDEAETVKTGTKAQILEQRCAELEDQLADALKKNAALTRALEKAQAKGKRASKAFLESRLRTE